MTAAGFAATTSVAFSELYGRVERNTRVALVVLELGWQPLPWLYDEDGKKTPKVKWVQRFPNGRSTHYSPLRDRESVIAQFAKGHYAGVITGPESGVFVVDVDPRNGGLETLAALEAQHGPLPATMRVSTPSGGFHLYFAYPSDRDIVSGSDVLGPGVDVRGWGGYVGAPGAITDKGEYGWPGAVTILPAPRWLLDQATRPPDDEGGTGDLPGSYQPASSVDTWIAGATEVTSSQDSYLFRFLCSLRARNVGPDEMRDLGWHVASAFTQTKPEPWTAKHVNDKVEWIVSNYPAGTSGLPDGMTQTVTQIVSPNGDRPVTTGEIVKRPGSVPVSTEKLLIPVDIRLEQTAPPAAPNVVARALLERFDEHGLTLVNWHDTWLAQHAGSGGRYERAAEDENRHMMQDVVRQALDRAWFIRDDERQEWNPTNAKIREVVSAVETFTRVPGRLEDPAWLDPAMEQTYPARKLIVVRNGILYAPGDGTRVLLPHNRLLLTETALDIAWDPHAPFPERWHRFLNELWPGDEATQAMVHEWMGYVISGETDLHKIWPMIGPPRSGKGTIIWVLARLLGGNERISYPTLKSLSGSFGLAPLLGKRFGVVSDAHESGDTRALVELLLMISGEDPVNVNRKNMAEISGMRLGVRFAMLSNTVLDLRDVSGALPNRFAPTRFTESFLGREDLTLKATLEPELPGILNLALDGLDRLRANGGKFTMSAASAQLLNQMIEMAAPDREFFETRCVVDLKDDNLRVTKQDLYSAYESWALANGRKVVPYNKFSSIVTATFPSIRDGKPVVDGRQKASWFGIRLW